MSALTASAATSGRIASPTDAAMAKTRRAVLMAAMTLPLRSVVLTLENRVRRAMSASPAGFAVQQDQCHVAVTAATTPIQKFAAKIPASTAKKATAAFPVAVVRPAKNHAGRRIATIRPARYVVTAAVKSGLAHPRRPAAARAKPATTKTRRFVAQEEHVPNPTPAVKKNAVDLPRLVGLTASVL